MRKAVRTQINGMHACSNVQGPSFDVPLLEDNGGGLIQETSPKWIRGLVHALGIVRPPVIGGAAVGLIGFG